MADVGAEPAPPVSLTADQVAAEVEGTDFTTIVGFGSLLSPASAAGTCPGVCDFRLGRVCGWRRVFAHPAAIFFERGIAIGETKEIASLSAEPATEEEEEALHTGFVVATFKVPTAEVHALLLREEEFNFVRVPVYALEQDGGGTLSEVLCEGYMCTRSTDEEVLGRRGHQAKYARWLEPLYGETSIWGELWGEDSGIKPTPVYCRHCVLATQREGVPQAARDSFLDETFLADRATTLRTYLDAAPHVMESRPPEALLGRYSG